MITTRECSKCQGNTFTLEEKKVNSELTVIRIVCAMCDTQHGEFPKGHLYEPGTLED
jgi:protein-arginine kinase activator protein McsA